MTGSLSAHLMSSYNAATQSPFVARSATPGPPSSHMNPQICGPMSFTPSMHGTPYPSSISQAGPSGSFFTSTFLPNFATPGEVSEATAKRIATLQAKLDQKLGPEYISQRPGPGGAGKLTYAEGWKIINLANEVFGFNGWSSSIVNLTTDFVDYNEESRRFSVAATAIVRVTLADGVYHEDVGCGQVENIKSKAAAIDKCKKEAVTDAVKRALRNFGNVLGNCLYDKSYAMEVVKMKVPTVKFDKSQLYRRPEFQEPTTPASASSANANSSIMASPSVSSSMTVNHNSSLVDIKPPLPQSDNLLTKHQPSARPTRPVLNAPLQSKQNTEGPSKASDSSSRATAAYHHPLNPKVNGSTSMQNTTTNALTSNTNKNSVITTNHNKAMEHNATTSTGAAMELDKDESFTMNSEDDALFASVDMSEVDLGQPIYYDDSAIGAGVGEGNAVGDESAFVLPPPPGHHQQQTKKDGAVIGRPVNGDAGGVTSVSTSTTSTEDGGVISKRSPAPLANAMVAQPPRDAATIARRLQLFNQMLKEGDQSSSSSSSEVKPTSSSDVGSSNSNGSALSSSSTSTVSTSGHHTNNHGNGTNHHRSSGVGLSASVSSSSSSGGFYYTEGANAQRLGGNSSSDHTGSGIGMKRPVDAIQPQTAPRHATGPGMGLLQAQNGGGGRQQNHHHPASAAAANRRQPLGQLDIAPGGDVKRVKR